jgi:hypothetical protein
MEGKKWINLLLAFLAIGSALEAEVEEVAVTWNAVKCLNACVSLIEQNFNGIHEVSDLKIDSAAGRAVMKWRPNYPFSYEPFRYASAAVGIHITSMRLRVKGTVSHDSNDVYLTSSGDDSRFLLLGPIQTEPGRYTPKYNPATHPLPPEMRDKLLDAEKKGLPVVISGPLLLPSHYTRTLITEQIKVIIPGEKRS